MKKTVFTLIILIIYGCSQKKKPTIDGTEVKNIKTFAQIFGYIKYFHPSDEAYELDWDTFSIYATEKILECKTSDQFANSIYKLFEPIAPSIKWVNTETQTVGEPSDIKDHTEQFWYHQGVDFGMWKGNGTYISKRVKVDANKDTLSYRPKYGETVKVKISENKHLSIPLVVLVDGDETIPKPDSVLLKSLQDELLTYNVDETSLAFRIGNVVTTFNVFQHFFPYFEEIKVDWKNELENAIINSFADRTKKEHIRTLKKFTKPLQDGHISINSKDSNEGMFTPPIAWEWIGEKLIITNQWDDYLGLQKGDEVTKINGLSAQEYFKEIESMISAGTRGWLKHISNDLSLRGEKDSRMHIEANGRVFDLIRDREPYRNQTNLIPYQEVKNGVHYLNLSLIDMVTFEYLLPQLEKSSGIIFDLRGYPNENGEIIQHLIQTEIVTNPWLLLPITVFPDQQKTPDYIKADWNGFFVPREPYLGDRKIIFITDGSAISWSESLLSLVKGYGLATLVGQPTAGTNGDMNTFMLPGEIEIKWTGLKVVKLDGSQLFGIGILPDVYIEKTVDGIKNGKDEFLEKAIELVLEE